MRNHNVSALYWGKATFCCSVLLLSALVLPVSESHLEIMLRSLIVITAHRSLAARSARIRIFRIRNS